MGREGGHGDALELHPQELDRRHWSPGRLVRVSSRRGSVLLPVRPSDAVAPAQAFIAMHAPQVNRLTTPQRCPRSKQPELKHAAVRVEAADLPWQLEAAFSAPACAAG
ncbi:molybdopterin dinucleotide binding domain-containing protein [Piscinibacter sakaiensis]